MRAVVVANGELENSEAARYALRPDDLIVCADGGTRIALDLGVWPDVVIGDADSVPAQVRQQLEERGTPFIVYPVRKDETDAELALTYCIDHGADSVLFLGALGGRLDHALANLLLLGASEFAAMPIRILEGAVTIETCRKRCEISGQAGDIVTLLPWGGDVTGVVTQGLEYPLRDEVLRFGLPRGVSNVMTGSSATISVDSGLLLVYHQADRIEQLEGVRLWMKRGL